MPKKSPIELSLISPVHNEEKMIESFVQKAVVFLRKSKINGEVLIIENGSTDTTREILKKLQAKYPELTVEIMSVGNKGLALKRAFEKARGRKLVTLDTDLWDEGFVEASIKNLENYEIVIGSKVIKGAKDDRAFAPRFINWGYNFVMRLFFDFQGTETHAKLSFLKDSIMPLVQKCKTSELVFDTELILRAEQAGLSKLEIPTKVREVRPRRFGGIDQMIKTIKNCFVLLFAIGPNINWVYVLVFGAILLGAFLRLYHYHSWFFFSVDEEHYSFMTRMITVDHHFPLIGGPISGTKLYMAPWFLFFNAIWFLLSNNNPVFSGVIFAVIELSVVPLIYLIGKRIFSRRVGVLAAVLYGGSMLMALFDRHYWNITLTPFISTLTVYGLLNWIEGSKKWLIITAIVVGFGLSATFSIFAVFLFAALVILFYGRKDLLTFLAIIAVMHFTLVLFDLRHDFWLLRGLGEFFTTHSYDSVPFLQRVANTLTIFINTLGKSIVITAPLDLSDEISICTANISRYQPMAWAVGLAVLGLISYVFALIRSRFNKKMMLILILGLINIASLFLFRADPAERHWLPFLPMFFITMGVFPSFLWEKDKIVKIAVVGFMAIILSINLKSLLFSHASYGILDKEKTAQIITGNTTPGEYYLNTVGECHMWGYRYLMSEINDEPAASYLDDSFSWMYSSTPTPANAKTNVTVFAPNKNTPNLTVPEEDWLSQLTGREQLVINGNMWIFFDKIK